MFSEAATQISERELSRKLASERGPVWLRVGTLLDGVSTQPMRNAHLVFDDDGILHIGDEATPPPKDFLKPGQCAPDHDLPEFTVLPGLIDAHAHLFLEGGELDFAKRKHYLAKSADDLLALAQPRLATLVRLGVMAVRDAGDRHGVSLRLTELFRDSAQAVRVEASAYIDSPGAAIHHRGRYGGFMSCAIEDCESAKACVEERIAAGAHRIKLIVSGIINFKLGCVNDPPQMPLAEVESLVRASRSRGRQTFAHASGTEGIENALNGGVDSVEHGFFITHDQLSRMRDKRIAWVPTFAPVQAQVDHAQQMGWDEVVVSHLRRILDGHARHLSLAAAMGVQVIAGSDAGSCGVAHGLGLLYELELMEQAGMSSLAVLNAATGAGAERLGFDEPFGVLEAGRKTRLILTRYNPLETVTNLRHEKICVFDGQVFTAPEAVAAGGL